MDLGILKWQEVCAVKSYFPRSLRMAEGNWEKERLRSDGTPMTNSLLMDMTMFPTFYYYCNKHCLGVLGLP